MSIGDLPVLSALRTRMQWHQERQRVLAENVANSDTPNFKPRDLVEPKFDPTGASAPGGAMGTLPMVRTSGNHISAVGRAGTFEQNRKTGFETRPAGNAVNLEDEMLKVSVQPDGLRRRDLALQPQPASPEDRDRQGLKPRTEA